MKPQPAPEVPGKTPWERMDNAVRKIFSVSKDEIATPRRKRAKKRSRRKPK